MSPSFLVCEACLEQQHDQCLGEGCACLYCREVEQNRSLHPWYRDLGILNDGEPTEDHPPG